MVQSAEQSLDLAAGGGDAVDRNDLVNHSVAGIGSGGSNEDIPARVHRKVRGRTEAAAQSCLVAAVVSRRRRRRARAQRKRQQNCHYKCQGCDPGRPGIAGSQLGRKRAKESTKHRTPPAEEHRGRSRTTALRRIHKPRQDSPDSVIASCCRMDQRGEQKTLSFGK